MPRVIVMAFVCLVMTSRAMADGGGQGQPSSASAGFVKGEKSLRAYGGAGFTNGNIYIDPVRGGSHFSWSAGGQLLYRTSKNVRFGLDVNFLHAYATTNINNYWVAINYLCVHALAEYFTEEGWFLQGSVGLNSGTAWNDTKILGARGGGGYELRLSPKLSFALMIRLDFISEAWGQESEGPMIPATGMGAFHLKL